MSLNEQQKKAVETSEGRVLILAGAGSGKTSVLAYRTAHLLKNLHIPPEAILGLTFTNKAAEEMRHRVAKHIDQAIAKRVTLCTFHSFCMQVLRKEIHHLGYTSRFSLYDERDVKRLMMQLARHMLECDGEMPSLESTFAKISHAKSKGEEIVSDGEKWHGEFAKTLYERLHVCMRAYNAVDFDSLLSLTVQLFEQFPLVLENYQNRFRYIMIDEYQDTNPIQYKLATLLSAKHNNLCVVGDDDQSIYGWRGAEIKHILQFESKTIIKLEQNYRSTPTILEAANAVIRNNQERHNKQLWSTQEKGDLISLFHAPTEIDEAQAVIQRIIAMKKHKNLLWKDMAILYRSNILSRTFETALIDAAWEKDGQWLRGIPYQIFGGTELYERSEIKDLMAYLRAIENPLDQEALLRIINVPRRGISENALDLLTKMNRSQGVPLWSLLKKAAASPDSFEALSDKALKGIASFVSILETAKAKFNQRPLKSAFDWLIEEVKYKKAIEEEVKSDQMRAFKWENVLHCGQSLAQYEEQEKDASLQDFLSNTLLDQKRFSDKEDDLKEDKVKLMTFHGAKGLEFTACFLVGLEDHIIPHEKSLMQTGLEEERRLMYVAMTRAKQHLTLSMARKRMRMGKESNSNPSRFLFEIPQELLNVGSWKI